MHPAAESPDIAPATDASSSVFAFPASSAVEAAAATGLVLSPVLRNALASTAGAAVVATVVTPLDVVKVRLQAHVCPVAGSSPCDDPRHFTGSIDAARKIVRTDGVRGLWRGLSATLVLAIPTTGLYFTLYEALRHRLTPAGVESPPASTALVAGATARILSATASSPLELARTRLQAGALGTDATVLSVLRDLRQSQGFAALWRGLGPTLWRDAPFSAIYWTAYETFRDPVRSPLPARLFSNAHAPNSASTTASAAPGASAALTQFSSNFSVFLAAGIGAGGLAAICTVPADVIKTRRQAMIIPSAVPSPTTTTAAAASSSDIVREIVANEGVRGLFRGAGPRIAKVAPACAIMMTSFEFFRYLLGGTAPSTTSTTCS